MATAYINGQTRHLMKAVGLIIRCVAKEITSGVMVELTLANGSTIICMVSECTNGQMDAIMRVSTSKIKGMVLACSSGQTAANILDLGKRVRCMGRGLTRMPVELRRREFGSRGSAL